jgi:RND family efflux transporter MFP subunit
MQIISKVNAVLAKPYVKPALLVLVVLVIALIVKNGQSAEMEIEAPAFNPLVNVTSAANFVSSDSLSLIGTARAFTEAKITAETGGRVTSVNTTLGSAVAAGQVIATIENASEQATLLQAQGAYEAALASAAQSNVGVSEAGNNLTAAQNNVISTYKSAYNTSNAIVTGTIDPFFANPLSAIPGLRLSGRGYTQALNSGRVELQTTLPAWRDKSLSVSTSANLPALIAEARTYTTSILEMVDMFIAALQAQGSQDRYSDAEIQTFLTNFNAARANLSQTLTSLNTTEAGLVSAEEAKKRADISGSSNTAVSSADAQVKQALGSLRAAQANYAKTILRSPIAGTVNSLNIKSGDYISSFTEAAVVANNDALEIVSYVGDTERDTLTVGDAVVINGSFEGTITQISPAVDAATRKTEIRIAVENQNIKNGDTVKISRKQDADIVTVVTEIRVPLTAVKFEIKDGFVFTIEDGVLKSRAVTLGRVNANSVVITSGLEADQEFVVDVRGLFDGQEVEVKR